MILVCSAWEEETKYLDLCQDKFKIVQLGIGYLQAALNLQRFIFNMKKVEPNDSQKSLVLSNRYLPQIEKIYFIGTAGLISEANINWDMPVFSVNKVSLTLPLSLTNQAYVPKAYPEFILEASTELNVADCISSLEITSSSELSREIEHLLVSRDNLEYDENAEIGVSLHAYDRAVRKPLLENMELYGVAQVAQEFNIPCLALLGITNRTDAKAHKDWSRNHKKVSKLLCECFSELI